VAADHSLAQAFDLCAQAFERPRFADACPMDYQTECPGLVTFECQRLLAYRALDLAARGDPVEAVHVADRLLAGTIDQAQTGRGFLGQTVAQANLKDAFTVVDVLTRWLGTEAVAPLRARLRAFDPDTLRPELALVGEYVLVLRAFELMRSSGGEDVPGWLFSEGATRQILDRAYQEAAAGGPFVVPTQREGLLWWFHNPVGKLLLDGMAIGGHVWPQIQERDRALRAQHQALLSE
jgi:hypothetical protein